jgi:hypothetical protein
MRVPDEERRDVSVVRASDLSSLEIAPDFDAFAVRQEVIQRKGVDGGLGQLR